MGDDDVKCVRYGNAMASRTVLLFRLAHALGHLVCLEQPASSILMLYYRFQELLRDITIYKVRVSLGRFGADSDKPILIWSNRHWIAWLPSLYVRRKSPVSVGVTSETIGEDLSPLVKVG